MGIVDLITVGEEIHEGWNYYKIMDEDDVDAYSIADRYTYFRLYNAEADGCDNIGEVDMIGVQLMESTADTVTCNTQIVKPEFFVPELEVYHEKENSVVYHLD